jgi:hypothetical protein
MKNRIAKNEKLKTRKETVDGVEYLVCPCVLVKEQVLNGDFLPRYEIEKSVQLWEGVRVCCNHPVDEESGISVSANEIDSVNDYHIGYVWNVKYEPETTKLKADVYIDINKMSKNEETKKAYDKIIKSENLDVSTGYFCDTQLFESEFDGVNYNAVQTNLVPNHLALLPSDVGACSFDDGGGIRNNAYRHKVTIDDNEPMSFSKSMLETFYNIFPRFKPKPKVNAEKEQFMLAESILAQIQTVHNDVKSVDELYYDSKDKTDYAIFKKGQLASSTDKDMFLSMIAGRREMTASENIIYPLLHRLIDYGYIKGDKDIAVEWKPLTEKNESGSTASR